MGSHVVNRRTKEDPEKDLKPYQLFFWKLKNDWSLTLASMLAFNLLTALLPLALTIFGIFGLILHRRADLQERMRMKIIDSFPVKAKEGFSEIVTMAMERLYHDAALILTFGIIFAILASSRLFIAVDRCLTIIYRLEERKFLEKYLLALKMLVLFLILIPLMIIASSLPSILLDIIPNIGGRFGTYVLGFLSSLFVSFILFETAYLFIPNRKMSLQQTWRGAIIAASALQIIMILFPLYIRYFMKSYTGQMGFAFILLFFLFYFALILILGAQINAFFYEHISPLSAPLGTLVSRHADQTHNKISELDSI